MAVSEEMVERALAAYWENPNYKGDFTTWADEARAGMRKALTAALSDQVVTRPLSEWHEDMGAVLWWKFPVTEAPWCGTPLDDGKILTLDAQITVHDFLSEPQGGMLQFRVGGWPGYHTHFTPLSDIPAEPIPASTPVRSS